MWQVFLFVCLLLFCVCVCVFFVLLFGRSVATVTSRCLHMVHSSVHPLYVTAIFVYSPSRQVHTSHTYSHLIRKIALFSSASDVFIFVADFFFLLLFFFLASLWWCNNCRCFVLLALSTQRSLRIVGQLLTQTWDKEAGHVLKWRKLSSGDTFVLYHVL